MRQTVYQLLRCLPKARDHNMLSTCSKRKGAILANSRESRDGGLKRRELDCSLCAQECQSNGCERRSSRAQAHRTIAIDVAAIQVWLRSVAGLRVLRLSASVESLSCAICITFLEFAALLLCDALGEHLIHGLHKKKLTIITLSVLTYTPVAPIDGTSKGAAKKPIAIWIPLLHGSGLSAVLFPLAEDRPDLVVNDDALPHAIASNGIICQGQF